MSHRIVLTEFQKKFLTENWGYMTHDALARRLQCSRTNVRDQAKRLGLKVRPGAVSTIWTAENIALFKKLVLDGLTNHEIHEHHFPQRTFEAIKEARKRLRRNGWHAQPERVTSPPKPRDRTAPNKRAPVKFQPKEPPRFPPLQYTLAECPRVTLDYACQWMRQQVKGWERPADDKEAWLAINAQRLCGPIPVPPFLPDRRPAHNDNHKAAPLVLPEWGVGAR